MFFFFGTEKITNNYQLSIVNCQLSIINPFPIKQLRDK